MLTNLVFVSDYANQLPNPPIKRRREEKSNRGHEQDGKGVWRRHQERLSSHQFPFFKGDTLGLLDITVGTHASAFKAFHKALETEVIGPEPDKNPEFFKWACVLREHPWIKETLLPHDKVVAKMKEKMLDSPKVWYLDEFDMQKLFIINKSFSN